MPMLEELRSRFNVDFNNPVYIVGTGPTLRLFPVDFLKYQHTIGLNQAYKHLECDINLTIHPDLIPLEHTGSNIWIIKEKGTFNKKNRNIIDLEYNKNIYWFKNNKDVKDFEYIKPEYKNQLYVGRGIHTGAMVLAAKLGFKYAILVGCDMGGWGKSFHHAHEQDIQFHGQSPFNVYREYYLNARILRVKLKELYNIEFLSLSPCLAPECHGSEDFMFQIQDLETLPQPKDISTYKREELDFTS